MSNSGKNVRIVKRVTESAVNEIDSNFQPRIPVPSAAGSAVHHVTRTAVTNNTYNTIVIDIFKNRQSVRIGGGLGWFRTNWKVIAIAAASAAALYAIAKMIKGLQNSIKVRYNNCAKTLLRMQKDFTLEESGLAMSAVLPGVGTAIMDKLAGWLTAGKAKRGKQNHKGEGKTMDDGVIGLYPFCNKYKDEITLDFKAALEAFNKVAAAGETADSETGEGPKDGGNESFAGPVYRSFREACRADHLNESMDDEQLNEIALTAVSAAISLGTLAVRGGMFLFGKMGKDGKPEEQKAVQVTKESTREVCYAILNNYGERYVNMAAVFKKAGINGTDLNDVDKSSCDKLAAVLKKYGEAPSEATVSSQYARVKKMYDGMLQHYYNIGDGLIKNFVAGTKKTNPDMDEKHQNLLLASQEKLLAMWDSQKDTYDNSFSRIMVEITSCPNYQSYVNFIVERVIPVFKSGIAGDADYVLDVMPKKGEYYVVRQTQQDADAVSGEQNKGNVVLAKVASFDSEKMEITFTLEGLIKSSVTFDVDGLATIDDKDGIDLSAYREDEKAKEVKLPFGKWVALDPHPVDYQDGEKKEDGNQPIVPDGPVDVRVDEIDGKKVTTVIFVIKQTVITNVYVDGNQVSSTQYLLPEGTSDEDVKKKAEEKTEGETDINKRLGFEEKKPEELDVKFTLPSDDKGTIESIDKLPEVVGAAITDAVGSEEKKDDNDNGKKSEPAAKTDCYAREYVPDYYAVLGLTRSATADEIKAAYRELAKNAHPDANGGSSDEAMKIYNEVYGVLKDEAKRKEYDEKNPEGTVVVFATVASEEVARSFTRPFSSKDSLNEDGESDGASQSKTTDVAVRDEDKPAASNDASTDASANAEDQKFGVIRVIKKIGDKIESVVSYSMSEAATADSFDKFITQDFFGGHDGEYQYKLGFSKLEGDAEEYYNAEVTSSVNSENTEAFVKSLNEVKIEGFDASATERGANDEDQAKAAEDFMSEFGAAVFSAVVRDPSKQWQWVANPNPDANAQKAITDAQIQVTDVNVEGGASAFTVVSNKVGYLAPGMDEKSGGEAFKVRFMDNGYANGENKDASLDPTKVPIKMNAVVCDSKSQQAVVFGDGQWSAENINKALAQQIDALSKQGYKFAVKDQKSEAVNSSVEISYSIVSDIDESAYDNTITVNREISRLYRGYHILSEAHVYDGTVYDPAAALAESASRLMRKCKSKNDIIKYAKSNKNVKFGVFETSSSYKLRTAVKPSYYAPLYESVIAFRFDENGKIKDHINFGVKITY